MSTGPEGEEAYLHTAYPFAVIRDRLRRHPGPMLDFALGRRTEPPPEWLPGLLRENAELALRRRREEELDRFVGAATTLLERVYGARLPTGSFLPAPSGRAAMSALATSLFAPRDRVLVTEPGYPAFARIAAQNHARLVVATLDPEREFAPDIGGLRADGGGEIRAAALNFPNNPTGAVISPETLGALRDAIGREAVLFNDAIYGPLTFARAPLSLLAADFEEAAGNTVIELHSLGKLFSLGPIGLAFLVGCADRIAEIRQYSDFAWTQLSSLHVRAATRCIENWDHVDRVREGTRERLAALREVLCRLGFRPYPTAAGIYLLCRCPARVGGRPVGDAMEAAERLLDETGLAVAPWQAPPHGYLRFSTAYLPEDLDGLAELGRGSEIVAD